MPDKFPRIANKQLEPSPFDRTAEGKLMQIVGNPDFTIRKQSYATPESLQAAITTSRRMFRDLRRRGISVPATIQGSTPKDTVPTMNIVTHVITRSEISDEHSRQRYNDRVVKVLSAVAEHLLNAFAKPGSSFFSDIVPALADIQSGAQSQYIFGRKKGDVVDDIHLVDTDPFFSNDREDLLTSIDDLIQQVEKVSHAPEITDVLQRLRQSREQLAQEVE